MTAALTLACDHCTVLARALSRPGQPHATVECGECGAELRRDRPRPFRVRDVAHQVDQLLADAHALAVWWSRSCARAIDLDPESPRAEVTEDDSALSVSRQAVRERLLTRGRHAEARMTHLDARTAAVVRYLAERCGPARVRVVSSGSQQVGTSLYEVIGLAHASAGTLASWAKAGTTRMAAADHGRRLLEDAALAWCAVPEPVVVDDVVTGDDEWDEALAHAWSVVRR